MPENARKCVLLSDLGVFSPRGSIYMLINEVGPCLNIFSCRIRSKCWVFRLLGGGNGYNSWHWASFYRDRESILRNFKQFFGLKITLLVVLAVWSTEIGRYSKLCLRHTPGHILKDGM